MSFIVPLISPSCSTTLRIDVTSRASRPFSSEINYLGYACLFPCSNISVGWKHCRPVLLMQTNFVHKKLCSGEMPSKSEGYEVRIWLDMPKRDCHLSALIGSLFAPLHFFRNIFPFVIDLPVSDHVKHVIGPHKDHKGWAKCTCPFTAMF